MAFGELICLEHLQLLKLSVTAAGCMKNRPAVLIYLRHFIPCAFFAYQKLPLERGHKNETWFALSEVILLPN